MDHPVVGLAGVEHRIGTAVQAYVAAGSLHRHSSADYEAAGAVAVVAFQRCPTVLIDLDSVRDSVVACAAGAFEGFVDFVALLQGVFEVQAHPMT